MKTIRLFIAITALFLSMDSLFAFSNNTFKKEQLNSFLNNAVKTYNIPGLAIAIVDNQGVLYNFCFGQIDNYSPITLETPFLLGSTSKTFTAMAVMSLVEKGEIDLDKPIKNYLPDFYIQNHKYESQITVRHLLNHTSGLSGKDLPKYSSGENSLTEELVTISQCNPKYAPGTHYEYFNSNYRVLGLLIERISGIPFNYFLKQQIFNPLSMHSSHADINTLNNLVQGHGQIFGFAYKRTQRINAGGVPSGYMTSSVTDISKFLIEELKTVNQEGYCFHKETVVKTWTAPNSINSSYAMGWLLAKDSIGNQMVVHGGALENYQSFFYLNPNRQLGFVILMNQGGVLSMINFSKIRDGVISIIENREPEIKFNIFPLLSAFLILLVMLLELIRIKRLRHASPTLTLKRKISIIIDFAFVIFIIGGFIPLMNYIMGDKADWSIIYNMLPEFCLLLLIICTCNLICGIIKIENALLLKNKFKQKK